MTPRDPQPPQDYVIRVHSSPLDIPASAWNGLLARQARPTPFMRHEYLAALHTSGSATAETGWAPQFVTLHRADADAPSRATSSGATLPDGPDTLLAACAMYAKSHSYGEYVFDWSWADAYRRHGLRYYPKWLSAVPFTPVPGTRLMAADGHARARLAEELTRWVQASGLSSAHVLFVDDQDRQALADAGWMCRQGVQFHWTQDPLQPMGSLDDLLGRLQRDKRKKILQERRKVHEQGVRFEVREGPAIDDSDWDFFYRCYTLTYQAHHSTPYLTRPFFAAMARDMPQHWVMFIARRGDRRIAASLVAVDREQRSAWGRYWGCVEHVPCLHFEACYYQPLAWCLQQGIERFEGGAQGEHKMARGLLPTGTASAHWLRDARFAEAVGDFLAQESEGIGHYVDELRERSPFKPSHPPVDPRPEEPGPG